MRNSSDEFVSYPVQSSIVDGRSFDSFSGVLAVELR